ncbi:MAG: ribosome biogenesis/translation initiation ATPase RLI [Candidatus Aenigmarchaeota archaeon]|nr:ribosome biogenesis/translation initiation ATPase RLI [Candidatus Aenigmarchaeota archaeon]
MPQRIAVVDRERCKPDKSGEPCVKVCPVNRQDEKCIWVANEMTGNENVSFAHIDESLCIGCGLCVKKCPFHAITVINLAEELKESPVHMYGSNMFRLYRLPIPLEGKIVGLLGPNGVGKTTALKILSSQMKPNMGNYNEIVSWNDVIENFRGSELHLFLERLSNSDIKVSYKPQEISFIPNLYSGKVLKILKNTDRKLLKDLEIEELMDQDISKLSGGELQRISIAACLSKEADLYCLDEPGSFCDIRHRVNISKIIRKFTETKNKPVLIVEHDLGMLDMLCDNIHILYGASGAYGIVSYMKTTRKGINDYLEGFLPEENVRMRQDKISFAEAMPEYDEGRVLFRFPEMKKRYEKFSLSVSQGMIHQKEVIGVLGANALGKTTFLRLIAGIEKPSEGAIESRLKIAYKEQHPKSEYKGTVEDFLSMHTKYFSEEWFRNQILYSLHMNPLMDKIVKNLSGGEMQKLAIAHVLGSDADLIVLDEPSAYIDIESRWELAKIIRTIIKMREVSAFVVDHDIQFIDFISDKILLFRGKSGVSGQAIGPLEKKRGMNEFMKYLDITYRRDSQTKQPRINKPGSQKDQEQKAQGKYYY